MSGCSCREAFQKLDDFLCRELTAEEIASVEEHLCKCVECAEAYQFEGKMLLCIKKKVEMIALPADLMERVKKALDGCE